MPRKSAECFSESLRFLLGWYGIQQTDLVGRFANHSSTINRWAKGVDVPTWKTFDQMCAYFGVEPDEMMDVRKLMARFAAENVPRTLPSKRNQSST